MSLLSHVWLFANPWTAACQASLSFTISQSLLKLMSTESVMPSNYFILRCPLLLLSSIFLSIWVFSKEFTLCIRWPKYWNFSFIITPSNEYLGWFPLRLTGLISLLSKGLSSTTIQKHQLFIPQPSLLPSSHDYCKKSQFWLDGPLSAKWCLCFLTDTI